MEPRAVVRDARQFRNHRPLIPLPNPYVSHISPLLDRILKSLNQMRCSHVYEAAGSSFVWYVFARERYRLYSCFYPDFEML